MYNVCVDTCTPYVFDKWEVSANWVGMERVTHRWHEDEDRCDDVALPTKAGQERASPFRLVENTLSFSISFLPLNNTLGCRSENGQVANSSDCTLRFVTESKFFSMWGMGCIELKHQFFWVFLNIREESFQCYGVSLNRLMVCLYLKR